MRWIHAAILPALFLMGARPAQAEPVCADLVKRDGAECENPTRTGAADRRRGIVPRLEDVRPVQGASLGPMPSALGTRDLSPRELLATVRSSMWVLHTQPGGGTTTLGSAVAVSPRHLLTACHLFGGTSSGQISQGSARRPVSVVLRDDRSDRCILSVAQPSLSPVRAVRPFRQLVVGEPVYSLGAPAGQELTLGAGVISAMYTRPDLSLIQTSAPMSPGSSGGGLFDARGNLVGIVAFRLRNGQVLGFAFAADGYWALR